MDSRNIKDIVDGLASKGVLSAEGRRIVFTVLLEQSKEFQKKIDLLEDEVSTLRQSRDAAIERSKK